MFTCHQLHAEAAAIFYARNTFIYNDRDFKDLPKIAEQYRPLVRRALVNLDSRSGIPNLSECISALRAWPHVSKLSVRVATDMLLVWQLKLRNAKDREELLRKVAEYVKNDFQWHGLKISDALQIEGVLEGRGYTSLSTQLELEWEVEELDDPDISEAYQVNQDLLLEAGRQVLDMAKSMQKGTASWVQS